MEHENSIAVQTTAYTGSYPELDESSAQPASL